MTLGAIGMHKDTYEVISGFKVEGPKWLDAMAENQMEKEIGT